MLGKLSHSGAREWCVALVSQEERRETKGNTDYFPVAHFSLLINQTSNIPRSSSITNVKKKNPREKSRLSNQNTAEESLLNITGIQGVLILYVCVWARESVCVCLCVKVIQQLLQQKRKRWKVLQLVYSLKFKGNTREMYADKFNMLFMFTVAEIFRLITVRWDVFPLQTRHDSHAIS